MQKIDPLSGLEQIRWGGKPQCPYCGSMNATSLKKEGRHRCNSCFTSYSVTVGTLFHKTHVDLQKWYQAIHLVMAGESISVRKLAQEISVNKNTASYMLTRIRKAMQEEQDFLYSFLGANKP